MLTSTSDHHEHLNIYTNSAQCFTRQGAILPKQNLFTKSKSNSNNKTRQCRVHVDIIHFIRICKGNNDFTLFNTNFKSNAIIIFFLTKILLFSYSMSTTCSPHTRTPHTIRISRNGRWQVCCGKSGSVRLPGCTRAGRGGEHNLYRDRILVTPSTLLLVTNWFIVQHAGAVRLTLIF